MNTPEQGARGKIRYGYMDSERICPDRAAQATPCAQSSSASHLGIRAGHNKLLDGRRRQNHRPSQSWKNRKYRPGSPPGITGFTPASGPVGTAVTISGSDFTDVAEVTINDFGVPFTVESNSAIKFTVVAGAETGPLFVTSAGGSAMTDTFFVVTPQPVAAVVLSATPATQSASAGQSINYSIAISRMNMPNPMEPVTLAVSGLPMGATATYSPNPATGNNEMLTIMTTASTPGGPSTLTITGTASGATIAPITVSLTINPPVASVSLSARPPALGIPAGGNTRYNIMLNRTNFTGAVNLAVSGLPRGATAGFTQNPTSSTNAVLMVSTLANTPPGTYVLTVSGTASGVSIAPTTVSLTVATPKGKEKKRNSRSSRRKSLRATRAGRIPRIAWRERAAVVLDFNPLEC